MDWDSLSDDERLIAERAVTAYRAVQQAARAAPHGRGMACIEQAVHKDGMDVLRQMVQLSASEHAEAQKRGPAAGRAPAAKR